MTVTFFGMMCTVDHKDPSFILIQSTGDHSQMYYQKRLDSIVIMPDCRFALFNVIIPLVSWSKHYLSTTNLLINLVQSTNLYYIFNLLYQQDRFPALLSKEKMVTPAVFTKTKSIIQAKKYITKKGEATKARSQNG